MKKTIKEKNIYLILCGTAVLYLLLFSPYTTVLNDYFGYDTALWHVIGKGITQGFVPYRDLFEHKGPLLFFIYSFGWFFENQRLAMFLLQSAAFCVTLVYLYRVCRLFTNQIKSLLAMLFFLLVFCGTISEGAMSEEWSLPFIVITLFYSLRYLLKEQTEREHPVAYGLIYGICFGFVAMIRLNNAAPIAGVILAFIIIMIRQKKIACIFKNAAAFLVGMLLPILPIVFWYWKENALDYLWWGAFLFNFHYAVNAEVVQPLWEKIRPWLMTLPYFVLVPFAVDGVKNGEEEEKDGYILFGVTATVTMLILMFGSSFLHYYTIFLPIMTIGFCIICEKWMDAVKKNRVVLATAVVILIAPFLWQAMRNAGKTILFNTRGWYDNLEGEIRDFMSQIPEEERDSVWGNGSSFSKVFCIAQITPCFPYFDNGNVHYVMDPSMNDKTVEMFENNPPKWIVVVSVREANIEAMEKYVPEMYQLHDVLDGEKHLELYRLIEE